MAKIVGLVGAVSGKVGNFVGAVVGGVQTMRVYQPIVANPRTVGQVQQRGKVNLAGQLTSVITRVAIEGLPGNARQRRSTLNKNLINAVTIANNVYSVKGESIVFSKGVASPTHTVTLGNITREDANVVSLTMSASAISDAALANGGVVRLIVLAVPKPIVTGQAKPSIVVFDWNLTPVQTQSTDIAIDTVGDVVNYNFFAYVVPLTMVNSAALDFDYLNSLTESEVIKLDGKTRTSGAYTYGDSMYLGVKAGPAGS